MKKVYIAAPVVGVVTVEAENEEDYYRQVEEIRRATIDY
jgi:hypothetical protein